MTRRLWKVFLILGTFCFGHSGFASADGVAPVYVPNGPQAAPLTAAENIDIQASLPTVTVRGFLNFRTTVDGTVIVFTPASETIEPHPLTPASQQQQQATRLSSLNNVQDNAETSEIQDLAYTSQPKISHHRELENEANADDDDGQSFRHLKAVSDDAFLQQPYPTAAVSSSQPEVLLVKTTHRPTPSLPQYPTGLVTVLDGTHVENSATTIFETKVIGTYIDGKYAQILQSTSRIIYSTSEKIPDHLDIKATSTLRERIDASSARPIKHFSSRAHSPSPVSKYSRSSLSNPDRRKDEGLVSNALLQSSFKLPENTPQRSNQPTQYLDNVHTRSSYPRFRRPKPITTHPLENENTVFQPRPNRRPTLPRYSHPPRSTPTVQLNRFKIRLPTIKNDASEHLVSSESEIHTEDDLDEDHDPLLPVDPAQVIYDRTTLTSQVTIHVGRRQSVRTLTIPTTVPRAIRRSSRLSSGLQDIVAVPNALIATSVLDGDALSTPQVVMTRTYTTTERMLRTSLVPVLDGTSTAFHTVTESFFILKIITAYKTLPPGDVTVLNTETDESQHTIDPAVSGLLYGATPLPPSPQQHLLQTPQLQPSGSEHTSVPLPLDLSHPLKSLEAALSQNPLAAVYLGLHQLNRQVTMYSTITKTSTYVTTDTVYSTRVVSFYDGRRTRSRTLSESISTTERTLTSFTTTVTPYLNTQALQHLIGSQPHLPLPPPTTEYSILTSSYTTVTMATDYNTRVYTLIYNAISTKLRTVTSSSVYETTITTFRTTEVPIAPTAPPGGGYPYFG